jgi:hypothetical protein
VNHPHRRTRIRQVLLAIHVSGESSHTKHTGLAPHLLQSYMAENGISLRRDLRSCS